MCPLTPLGGGVDTGQAAVPPERPADKAIEVLRRQGWVVGERRTAGKDSLWCGIPSSFSAV